MSVLRTAISSVPFPPSAWPRRLAHLVRERIQFLRQHHRASASTAAAAHDGAARPAVLRAAGDMTDWDAVQTFASRSAARLSRSTGPLVVDLSAVDRADTKLIACLVCLVSSARHAGRHVEFRFSPSIDTWVSLCGLGDVLGNTSARTPSSAA